MAQRRHAHREPLSPSDDRIPPIVILLMLLPGALAVTHDISFVPVAIIYLSFFVFIVAVRSRIRRANAVAERVKLELARRTLEAAHFEAAASSPNRSNRAQVTTKDAKRAPTLGRRLPGPSLTAIGQLPIGLQIEASPPGATIDNIEILGDRDDKGTVCVYAIQGRDTWNGARRRVTLSSRTILVMKLGNNEIEQVDNCGVALARLAGITAPIRISHTDNHVSPIKRTLKPAAGITEDVDIVYVDRKGAETARRITVIFFEKWSDRKVIYSITILAWCHAKRSIRMFHLAQVREIKTGGQPADPNEWARACGGFSAPIALIEGG